MHKYKELLVLRNRNKHGQKTYGKVQLSGNLIKTNNKIAMRYYVLPTGKANVCRDTQGWQEQKISHHIHMEMQSGTDFLLGTVVSFQICTRYNQQFHF